MSIVVAAIVGGLMTAFASTWLSLLGTGLTRADTLVIPTTTVVVLSGSFPDRILEGADTFREVGATRLLLTREPPLPGGDVLRQRGVPVAEGDDLNRAAAIGLGVPEAAITVLDPAVSSTFAEAALVVDFLRRNQIHSVVVVTSKNHSRRAAWTFQATCGHDCEVRMRPSRYDPFNPDDWWRHRGLVRRVIIEYGKFMYFTLVDRWRL